MNDTGSGETSREIRLNEILAKYLQARQRGETPDRQGLAANYPEFAADLRRFFADHDRFEQAAVEMKAAAGLTEPTLDIGTPSELPSGERLRYFGDYEILAEIARGGMGVVYRARQVNLKRIVALKMVLAGQLASPADIQRFYAEAEAAAKLAHPNIVPIFEVGQHARQHYFSMAYIDGDSLAWRVSQGVFEPREAAKLLIGVASAIAYAHVEGVIHRDLKPGNILVERDGTPRVTDFGLAKRVEGDASGLTATGQVLGTPSYMPPEQARGDSSSITPLSDVYSLGAVLYCLVTGRPPFQAASAVETLLQVLTSEPVTPRGVNPAVPLDLETIILKCLEKDPPRRYASAQHLRDELVRFVSGRPILARPLHWPARTWRWSRRHRLTAGLIAGVAASLLLGTLAASYFAVQATHHARDSRSSAMESIAARQRADASAMQAVANAQRAERHAELAKLNARRADEEAATRLFERGLEICEHDNPRRGLLWLARGLQQAERIGAADLARSIRVQLAAWSHDLHPLDAILSHTQPVLAVAFASDGGSLVTAGANPGVNSPHSTAQRWSAATNQPLDPRRQQQHASVITTLYLAPDANLLLTGSLDTTARVWSMATGEPVGPPLVCSGCVVTVALSPDGATALTAGEKKGQTCLWKLGAGEPRWIPLVHASFARSAAFSADGRTLITGDQAANTVQLWNAENGEPEGAPLELPAPAQKVALNPTGDIALTASGREVRLWDLPTRQLLGPPLVSASEVTAVAFSPDGTILALGDSTGAQLWDIAPRRLLGQPLRLMAGWSSAGEEVACLAFSPDGQKVVAGGLSGSVHQWRITQRSALGYWLPHQDQIKAAVFSPNGQTVVTCSHDHTARLWNVETGEAIRSPLTHEDVVWAAAFSPDSESVLTGSNDKTARIWEVATGQRRLPILSHSDLVMAVAYQPDGKSILTASSDVRVWDAKSGQPRGAPLPHSFRVRAMQVSPDGLTVATCMDFSSTQLWDLAARKPLGAPIGDRTTPLGFTSDSSVLATMGADQAIRLWDARTGQPTPGRIDQAGQITAVAFKTDGTAILTGNADGIAQVWDPQTRMPLSPPLVHPGSVHAVAFHPNGRMLATGCSAGRLPGQAVGTANAGETRIWDGLTGKMLGAPRSHPVFVEQVVFSPDGTRLLTGGADKIAHLSKLPTPLKGDSERATLWVQVTTGLELQDTGVVRVLDADAWRVRRARLENLDTATMP